MEIKKKVAFVTGANGFVGPYLVKELLDNNYSVFVSGLDKLPSEKISKNISGYFSCDIRDYSSVERMILSTVPDVVFHLAGFSSVRKSFETPDICFDINVNGGNNLVMACMKLSKMPILLLASSSEVYGAQEKIPINENAIPNPLSPYAASRLEQEKNMSKYPNLIIVRAFNHTGVGQLDDYVIPSFIKQVSEAKCGGTISVGNLDVVRDFSDVADVVKAYRIISEKGKFGELYNVGSGIGYLLRDVLNNMIKEYEKKILVVVDKNKYRPSNADKIICDNSKVKKLGVEVRGYFAVHKYFEKNETD
jgi:GDP-4-dehydro-6-deoxy-D-mannose reductase